jgi:hypothetical protein
VKVLGAILDLVGYVQTPLGAVLAIAAVATPFCVCGSSRTLGQRPSTQTALLKPDLLIARGNGDAEETATPVPSARRHL